MYFNKVHEIKARKSHYTYILTHIRFLQILKCAFHQTNLVNFVAKKFRSIIATVVFFFKSILTLLKTSRYTLKQIIKICTLTITIVDQQVLYAKLFQNIILKISNIEPALHNTVRYSIYHVTYTFFIFSGALFPQKQNLH